MASELLPFDRRMIIMSMLMHNKKITRRSGRYGGIYLADEYNKPKLYLSADEEIFLTDLLKYASDKDKRIINNILNKFSMPVTV